MFVRTNNLSERSPKQAMKLLNTAGYDPVTELLSGLRVHSSVYCLSDLRAPWGFRVAGADVPKFHLVLDGGCWLRIDGGEPVRLRAGDLAIVPGGERHTMTDAPDSAAIDLDEIIAANPLDTGARLSHGGDGGRTRLLCGGFALAEPRPAALLGSLPRILILAAGSADAAWIGPVLALVRAEASSAGPGSQAVFARLADVFLTEALRAHLTGTAPAPVSHDARIAAAIELLCNHPDRTWTVQSLARAVGMSRTSLSTSFRAATGDSPMRHLARLRLRLAAGYLASDGLSVEAIARRTGYASDAALSKAFRREYGMPPGAFRQRQGDGR